MTKPQREVPAYLIERLLKGELPPEQAAQVRAELEHRPGGVAKVQSDYAAADAEVLSQHPPARVAAAITQKAEAARVARKKPLMWPALSVAVAGAAALALFIERPSSTTKPQSFSSAEEVIGVKGMRPHLVVYRKHEGAPQRLTGSDSVRPGDVLQLAYVLPSSKTAEHAFGAIVSIDAQRSATLHFPLSGGSAPALERKGETRLPNAYELDASPGFERFVLVLSSQPFSADDVRDALAEGRPLPPSFTKFEITLLKELP